MLKFNKLSFPKFDFEHKLNSKL